MVVVLALQILSKVKFSNKFKNISTQSKYPRTTTFLHMAVRKRRPQSGEEGVCPLRTSGKGVVLQMQTSALFGAEKL